VFRSESFLRLGNDGGEGSGVGDREIREDLTVSFDSGSFQSFDEARVGHVLIAAGSVDTLSPQTAELTFALFPISVFIRQRFTDSVLGVTEEFRAETAETLGNVRLRRARLAGELVARGIFYVFSLNRPLISFPSTVSTVRVSLAGSGCVKAVR
jgi:hypothetical protein